MKQKFKAVKLAAVNTIKSGAPSSVQLDKINEHTITTHTDDQIYVRTMYLAHNAIDRDRDVFSQPLLQEFVATLPGKGLFVKHPTGYDGDSGPGEGRFFEARLVEMSFEEARTVLRDPNLQWLPDEQKATILEASFYLVKTSDNETLRAKLDGGVAGDVSIGFRNHRSEQITDTVDPDKTVAYKLLPPGEALEGSLVWLGAQPGARIIKHAGSRGYHPEQGDSKKLRDPQVTARALSSKRPASNTHTGKNGLRDPSVTQQALLNR